MLRVSTAWIPASGGGHCHSWRAALALALLLGLALLFFTGAAGAQTAPGSASAPTEAVTQEGDMTILMIVAVSAAVVVTGLLGIIVVLMIRKRPAPAVAPTPVPSFEMDDRIPEPGAIGGNRPEASLLDPAGVTGASSIALEADVVVLGRSRQNAEPGQQAVVLPRRTVGRRHASVEYRGHAYYLVDQGSVNGTFLNGSRIEEPTVLHDGDAIRLESVDLTFSLPIEGASERTMMAPAGEIDDRTLVVGDEAPASGAAPASGGLIGRFAAELEPEPAAPAKPVAPPPAPPPPAPPPAAAPPKSIDDAGDRYGGTKKGGLIAQMMERGLADEQPHGDDAEPGDDAAVSPVPGDGAFTIAPEFEVAKDRGPSDAGITIAPDFAVAAERRAARVAAAEPDIKPGAGPENEAQGDSEAGTEPGVGTDVAGVEPPPVPPVAEARAVGGSGDAGGVDPRSEDTVPDYVPPPMTPPAGPRNVDPRTEDTIPDYDGTRTDAGDRRDPRFEETIAEGIPLVDEEEILEPEELEAFDPDIAAIFTEQAEQHAREDTSPRSTESMESDAPEADRPPEAGAPAPAEPGNTAAPVDEEDRADTAGLTDSLLEAAAPSPPSSDPEDGRDTGGMLGDVGGEPAPAVDSPLEATQETQSDEVARALADSRKAEAHRDLPADDARPPAGRDAPRAPVPGSAPEARPAPIGSQPVAPVPAASTPATQQRAWLHDIDGATRTPRFEIRTARVVVGRSAPNPDRTTGRRADGESDYLTIRRNTIGRRHAYIGWEDGAYFIEDYQSINGTYVNGERLVGRVALTDGDRIAFDEFNFRLEVEPPPPPAPAVHFRPDADEDDDDKTQMLR